MRSRTWLVACLLFGSGFCALVYQVAWLRDFRLIFGSSTAASAAVLAIFVGGLGLGGWVLGPRADRHPRPLLFYAQLESIVAVSAAATPFLLRLAEMLYLAGGGSARLGITVASAIRLVLSALVLAVPTIAMGGTLPAAARGVTKDTDVRRHDVAVLYGVNTFGAVAGCVVATFFLLEILGTRSTLWFAAAVNLLVAMLARQADRSLFTEPVTAEASETSGTISTTSTLSTPVAFVLAASATVGFAFFLMELVWYRLLAPLIGGSVFTFGLVLAVALVGIGVGGLLYAFVADDEPATLSGFAWCCLLEAAAVAATYALGDRIALLAMVLVPLRSAGFVSTTAAWSLVTAIVVLPPALVAGYQFPLLIALFGRGRDRLGRQIGYTYTANTIGAIVGSLAGGFGFLPWLSAPGTWQLVAIALLALAVVAAVLAARTSSHVAVTYVAQVALAIVVIVLVRATGPTAVWRDGAIGAGHAPADALTAPNNLRSWSNAQRSTVVWEVDGTESGVSLDIRPSGYAFFVNGKSDGAARGDAATQVMLGLLGAVVPAHPRRGLVIGLGTGSSAGWLAAIPEMERVDVVELEPIVLDVARACEPVNQNVLNNPKVRVQIGDAREMLLTTRERYDVIASEPSNPFRAGIASLFTVEYYRAANDRLTDDGVFAQWVQAYEIDARTLQTIYATMAGVFPQIETWQTQPGDLVIVGSKHPRRYRADVLAGRITAEPFRSALAHAWRAVDLNGFLAHYVANDTVARALGTSSLAEVNTDDRNIVEFGLARSLGRNELVGVDDDLRSLAHAMNSARPPIEDGSSIPWPAVDAAWVSYSAWSNRFPTMLPPDSADEQARRTALAQYFGAYDHVKARSTWQRQANPPRDPTELLMVADLAAEAGSDDALSLVEQLRSFSPGEADVLLATMRLQQSKVDEAAAAVEAALIRFRTDPWPILQLKGRAIETAAAIARRNPALARRMFDALAQPFALRSLDDVRLTTAAALVMRTPSQPLCREAVAALEPFVPWRRDFLTIRRDCYLATGDTRLTAANRDLGEFLSAEAARLGSLIQVR
jgi:spermidine synthase